MKKLSYLTITAMVLAIALFSTQANAAHWQFLGSRVVNDHTETDVIHVGSDEGQFRKLRLDVGRAAVELNRVVITFGNGDRQILERDRIIGKKGAGPVLDLAGGARYVSRVKLVYEAKTPGFKKATVRLYGA